MRTALIALIAATSLFAQRPVGGGLGTGGGGGGGGGGGASAILCNGSASATAATCPGIPAPSSYGSAGAGYISGTFIAGATSTGSPLTLNIDSLGAKNVFLNGIATSTTNQVINGQLYPFQYDGTQIQLISGGSALVGTSQMVLTVSGGNGVIGAACATTPCNIMTGYGSIKQFVSAATVGNPGAGSADAWDAYLTSTGAIVVQYTATSPSSCTGCTLVSSSGTPIGPSCLIGEFSYASGVITIPSSPQNPLNYCPTTPIQGTNITITPTAAGPQFDVPTGSTSTLGSLKCDGTSILCPGGVLSAVAGSGAVEQVTTTYQALASDFSLGKVKRVASGTFTVTLVASGTQPANGQCMWTENYGSGTITVARSGQNINGGTGSLSLTAGGTYPTFAKICSDGTDYYTPALYGGAVSSAVAATNLTQATTNCVPYQVGVATTGCMSVVNSAVFVTSGAGVPLEATALPSTVTIGTATIGTLTDGATVTWAIASAVQAIAVLTFTTHGGSRTLNITNPATTGFYTLKLIQDGTGGEGLILGTGCTWQVLNNGVPATTVTLTSTASGVNVLTFYYDGTNCVTNFH